MDVTGPVPVRPLKESIPFEELMRSLTPAAEVAPAFAPSPAAPNPPAAQPLPTAAPPRGAAAGAAGQI